MRRPTPRRRGRFHDLRHDDSGFTLTELMVSMAIMGVVMVLVVGGVLLASGTSARVDAAGTAQQQVHAAFDKLDRQVRWADTFSKPGTVGTSTYVEWLYTASGAASCYQLRLDSATQKLSERSWVQGSPTAATPWQLLADRVRTAAGATGPFTPVTVTPGAPVTLTRLRIQITSTGGGTKLTDAVTHDVTYTAVNSGGVAYSPTTCSEGRPTS